MELTSLAILSVFCYSHFLISPFFLSVSNCISFLSISFIIFYFFLFAFLIFLVYLALSCTLRFLVSFRLLFFLSFPIPSIHPSLSIPTSFHSPCLPFTPSRYQHPSLYSNPLSFSFFALPSFLLSPLDIQRAEAKDM